MYFQENFKNFPAYVIGKTYKRGVTEPLHQHSVHQLLIVKDGLVKVVTDNKKFIITQNKGVWIAKNTYHSLTVLKNTKIISAFVEPLARADLPNTTQVVTVTHFLQELLEQSIGIDSNYRVNTRQEWITELVFDELRQLSPLENFELPMPQSEKYRSLCDEVLENIHYQWNMADFSKILHISQRTVSRQFYQQTGLTFIEWLRRSRIQRSLILLLEGESVINVALTVGYDSPNAFSTAFKNRIGLSPSQYVTKNNLESFYCNS